MCVWRGWGVGGGSGEEGFSRGDKVRMGDDLRQRSWQDDEENTGGGVHIN